MIKLPVNWMNNAFGAEIVDDDGHPLVGKEHEEVCRRVNVHDALVAALEHIADWNVDPYSSNGFALDDAIETANEALKLAKGE